MFVFNDNEPQINELQLEENFYNLIKYDNDNYIVAIKQKIFFSNGDSYDGDWEDGKKEGFGVYKGIDGTQYKGQWKNEMKHGQGIMIFSEGNTYKGKWVDSRLRDLAHMIGLMEDNTQDCGRITSHMVKE